MRIPRHAIAAVSLALAAGATRAQTAAEAELARRIDLLAAELAAVRAELAQLQQRNAAAPATAAPAAPAPAAAASEPPPAAGPATVLTGYGELNYNRPTRQGQLAQADMRRFVLGLQHRFDDRTKIVTELEVEHGVSSADDPGEVEVEQAYVERQLTPVWSLRAGLFLMPVGLLNENHEPTAYYGVERNFVETAIIPSTWREGGAQIVGNLDSGLTVQGGLSTGFDLTKWDPASAAGRESPLASIHQELALARSHDLAAFGALNWRGVPGLTLGGSLFTGLATQGQTGSSSRITLWDLHARWTPGRWDLAALATRGAISGTAALNTAALGALALDADFAGKPTLIPASFDGAYLQAAYKVWSHEDYALSPFVRWERYNTARSYADLGPGLTPDAGRGERVVTLGANFQLTQGIVVKADFQRFRDNADLTRLDLGLGWSF